MIKTIGVAGLALTMTLGMAACGGGGDTASDGSADMANVEDPSGTTPEDAPAGGMDAGKVTAETPVNEARSYRTQHDPGAVYTMDDLTMEGSYLKIDFEGLSPEQMNRVIHRLRTEFCTCGCPNDPIDQCLVNDPACGTAVTLTNQIIREEKLKG